MSSNDVAIAVRGLSKQYKIQHAGAKYVTLAETLLHRVKNGLRSTTNETFWALKDVSFEVKRGEVLGVIGRNGAGKSTLLKVMSRITEPTEGEVEMHGRVGSLLEVGTGFHPELTGRENIFLNGAILGMKRSEIQRQFDAIVDFAEVEKFLDTPVKRYSSGMYTRLAFSVAAHLQPEILIVDEVLSVGDAQFQQKCLGKMKDVAGKGRTVLFVSHNMGAVRTLCARAMYLQRGTLAAAGDTATIVDNYVSAGFQGIVRNRADDNGCGFELHLLQPEIACQTGQPLAIKFRVHCPREIREATCGMVAYDGADSPIFGASSKLQGSRGAGASMDWEFCCKFGSVQLNAGTYVASIWFGDRVRDCAKFSHAVRLIVESGDPFGCGQRIPSTWGHFYAAPEWSIAPAPFVRELVEDTHPSPA